MNIRIHKTKNKKSTDWSELANPLFKSFIEYVNVDYCWLFFSCHWNKLIPIGWIQIDINIYGILIFIYVVILLKSLTIQICTQILNNILVYSRILWKLPILKMASRKNSLDPLMTSCMWYEPMTLNFIQNEVKKKLSLKVKQWQSTSSKYLIHFSFILLVYNHSLVCSDFQFIVNSTNYILKEESIFFSSEE